MNITQKQTYPAFSKKLEDGRVSCVLCPINCKIKDGQTGKCRVRKNINNEIFLTNYGELIQASIDSLKNRPIYLLGEKNIKSLSIGLTGCNNTCPFCQNWEVSQTEKFDGSFYLAKEDIVSHALKNEVDYVSFTYTEPIVWIEFVKEMSNILRENKIKICLKTAGYISLEFQNSLSEMIDVVNLDIKPCNKEYLIKCGIYDESVVWSLAKIFFDNKKHLEISHIIIPEINDEENQWEIFSEKMLKISNEIPIHLLRHYPAWRSYNPVTSWETMFSAKKYLIERGHKHVFAEEVG